MKTEKITIEVIKFENGHILIGASIHENSYFVNVGGGYICNYTRNEIIEIYGIDPIDL